MDITIRQGETLQLPVESNDLSAETVKFEAGRNGTIFIDTTANFVDGKATIWTNDTDIALGEYEWMVTVTFSDGSIDKLPDRSGCKDGECDLPKLIVCEGAPGGVIS